MKTDWRFKLINFKKPLLPWKTKRKSPGKQMYIYIWKKYNPFKEQNNQMPTEVWLRCMSGHELNLLVEFAMVPLTLIVILAIGQNFFVLTFS